MKHEIAVRVPNDAHEDTDDAIKLLLKIMTYGGDYMGNYGKDHTIGISCAIIVPPYREISFCIMNRTTKMILLLESVKFNNMNIEDSLQRCFNLLTKFKKKFDETTRI